MNARKTIFNLKAKMCFLTITLLGATAAVSLTTAAAPKTPKTKTTPKPTVTPKLTVTPITLQVAVVATAESSGPWLAFTVTNHSTEPLEIIGPNDDPYRFLITKPDGSKFEDFSVIDGGGPRPTIAAGESKTWNMNAREILEPYKGWGLFRLMWQMSQWKGKELVTYKSNEVLLLRNPPPDSTPK